VTVVEPKAPTGLGFEEAAVTAAYSLGFEPAEIAGKPAPIQIVYTFKFPLPKPAAPAPRPRPRRCRCRRPSRFRWRTSPACCWSGNPLAHVRDSGHGLS